MAIEIPLTTVTITLDEEGTGIPVLLLHGFPSTRQLWSRVAPMLAAEGCRVLMPDLVGYGSSNAPDGVSIDMANQAHWILEMLNALKLKRVAIVAHDVGSAAAQIIVATAPQRVRGLVVLDGVYESNWAMEAIASIQTWDSANAHRLFPVLARRLATSDAMREMLRAYEGKHGGLRLIRAARDLDPRQTEHLSEALRESNVPALVVWGAQDAIFPVDTVARPLAKLLSANLLLVPGGHFTPLDCPTEVVRALREFILQLPP
jgi:pimeloyl-ACP methyl ester carboxylesterase